MLSNRNNLLKILIRHEEIKKKKKREKTETQHNRNPSRNLKRMQQNKSQWNYNDHNDNDNDDVDIEDKNVAVSNLMTALRDAVTICKTCTRQYAHKCLKSASHQILTIRTAQTNVIWKGFELFYVEGDGYEGKLMQILFKI